MKLLKQAIVTILIPSLAWSQIYVSTKGSDSNDGTKAMPLATVHMALRKAREMRRLEDPQVKNNIHIYV